MTREKLEEVFSTDYSDIPTRDIIITNILAALAAEKEEPLAVLADRKGYIRIQYDRYVDETFSIYIGFGQLQEREFYGETYAECEDKARQYLNGLPDTKGETE